MSSMLIKSLENSYMRTFHQTFKYPGPRTWIKAKFKLNLNLKSIFNRWWTHMDKTWELHLKVATQLTIGAELDRGSPDLREIFKTLRLSA